MSRRMRRPYLEARTFGKRPVIGEELNSAEVRAPNRQVRLTLHVGKTSEDDRPHQYTAHVDGLAHFPPGPQITH